MRTSGTGMAANARVSCIGHGGRTLQPPCSGPAVLSLEERLCQYSTAALRAPSLSNNDCFSASAGATRHSSGHCTSQSMPSRV